jgi:hypothetical protein
VVTEDGGAAQKVIEIIDLGYEANLVSRLDETGVVLEIHVGPFESAQQAESALTILSRSMHLDPYMVIFQPEAPQDAPPPPENEPSP